MRACNDDAPEFIRERMSQAGADDFLTKPVNQLELVTRVKSLLKAKNFHDELIKSKEKMEAHNEFKTIMVNRYPENKEYKNPS